MVGLKKRVVLSAAAIAFAFALCACLYGCRAGSAQLHVSVTPPPFGDVSGDPAPGGLAAMSPAQRAASLGVEDMVDGVYLPDDSYLPGFEFALGSDYSLYKYAVVSAEDQYPPGGHYSVRLEVTDKHGATDTQRLAVCVASVVE
jgi:hypothetical protein